jgi:hypothetical protein
MSDSHSYRPAVRGSTIVALLCVVLVLVSGVALVEPASAQAGAGNATNNTSANAPGGQLGRLNGTNGTSTNASRIGGNTTNQSGNSTAFAQSLAGMSSSEAKKAVRKNPQKTAKLASVFQKAGIGYSKKDIKAKPKKAAQAYLALSNPGQYIGGGGGGGNCGVTNPGACVPSAGELLSGFVNFIENSLTKSTKKVVGGFNDIFVGLPAPGEAGDLSTWATPENGWWPDIYETYYIFMTFAVAALLPAMMIAMDRADPYRREKELKRLAGHAVMVLLGALLIMPASLHLFDIVSTSLAPSGGEFLSSAAGVGKLSIGVILSFALAATQSSLVLIGLAIIVMIYVAIHILAAFWPIFWVARLAPVSSIEWVGNAGIASFYGLCFLRVLQSGMLRFLFNLSWDPIEAGVATAFGSVLLTIVGLIFVFIIFPRAFVRKGIPASAMLSGGSQAMKKAPERYKNSRERIGNVQQRLANIRGGDSGGSSTDGSSTTGSTTQVGSVGSTAASNLHHDGTVRRIGEVTSDKLRDGVDASQVERRRHEINDRLN